MRLVPDTITASRNGINLVIEPHSNEFSKMQQTKNCILWFDCDQVHDPEVVVTDTRMKPYEDLVEGKFFRLSHLRPNVDEEKRCVLTFFVHVIFYYYYYYYYYYFQYQLNNEFHD
jgi:hypothetical protein